MEPIRLIRSDIVRIFVLVFLICIERRGAFSTPVNLKIAGLSEQYSHENSEIEASHGVVGKKICSGIASSKSHVDNKIPGSSGEKTPSFPLLLKWNSDTKNNNGRSKRYTTSGSKWTITKLSYSIQSYPRYLNQETVNREIDRAFKVWSNHVSLTFTKVQPKNADIHIEFLTGEHGDNSPFYGNDSSIAHASTPQDGGGIHLDSSEIWSIDNSSNGSDLFQVVLHEIGHSLGLSHNENLISSIMYPFINPSKPKHTLDPDDIEGIQALYGRKRTSSTTEILPELCNTKKIDAIFFVFDDDLEMFVFSGAYVWVLRKGQSSFLGRIEDQWPGLKDNIDAAFEYEKFRYFIKDNFVWKYQKFIKEADYPVTIDKEFPGIPGHIDAASSMKNNQIYFFKNHQYWVYDHTQEPPVHRKYPLPIPDYLAVPKGLDAVTSFRHHSFYFKDDKVHCRPAGMPEKPTGNFPEFEPQSIKKEWFNCELSIS